MRKVMIVEIQEYVGSHSAGHDVVTKGDDKVAAAALEYAHQYGADAGLVTDLRPRYEDTFNGTSRRRLLRVGDTVKLLEWFDSFTAQDYRS